jgi:hypothetical protein
MTEIHLETLSDNPHTLIQQIAEAEGMYYQIAEQLVAARQALTEKTVVSVPPKSNVTTEMDRKITLEFKTREEQATVDLLEEQKAAIKQRVSVGQTILNYLKEERKVSGMGADII